MHTEMMRYFADGLDMCSHLYVKTDGQERRPGVLVFPEAFGLGEHAKSRAERLANLGYAALACDIHGGGTVYDDLGTVMGIIGELRTNPGNIRARAHAALAALSERPEVDSSRIAAIGYCFGGTMALELARSGAGIVGSVGFHSGLSTVRPQDASDIKGKVLVCIGADDPSIDIEQREEFEKEMRHGGVDWQMNVYGGVVHSFTNPLADRLNQPDFARYDAKADGRAWDELRFFLGEVFQVEL